MKTLKVIWCQSMEGLFGISVLERKDGKKSIRGSVVRGENVEQDMKIIADWGGTVSVEDLKNLIAVLEDKS